MVKRMWKGIAAILVLAFALPAAQAALISRSSVVLTPLWVFLGVGEVPSLLTLAGGAFVLAAVAGQGISALWATRARAA